MNKQLLALVATLALPASVAAAGDVFELVPGVVVDPRGDSVFLMKPGGGVEGVSLTTGRSLWTSERGDKPLALSGNRLIVQVEQTVATKGLEIVVLDTTGAGAVLSELRTDLPAGVQATVDDGMSRSFAARAETRGAEPLVSWRFEERYMKGVPPGPDDDPTPQVRQAAYRLDLAASRLAPVSPSSVATFAETLPASAQSWTAAQAAVSVPPASAGGVVAATRVVGDMTSPEGKIVLARWEAGSGTALPEVEIFGGPHVLQLRSADGRHLLVAERKAPGDFEEYEWSIFSLETGELTGQLRHHRSHTPFFVTGSNVVLVEPPIRRRQGGQGEEWDVRLRLLRAVALGSDLELWVRPLRDTTYYGPFPP